jgi:microcystin-dependent protein
MTEPFLAEIRIMSFGFPPKGWATCGGQLMPINQNQALFSLLGTTYGGDGRVNFGLPDLQGRSAMSFGSSGSGGNHTLGERGGEQNHTISMSEMPMHNHAANASSTNTAGSFNPTGAYLGGTANLYNAAGGLTNMVPTTIQNTGGSQAHVNMQPYLVLNLCIALQGIFPSQT